MFRLYFLIEIIIQIDFYELKLIFHVDIYNYTVHTVFIALSRLQSIHPCMLGFVKQYGR